MHGGPSLSQAAGVAPSPPAWTALLTALGVALCPLIVASCLLPTQFMACLTLVSTLWVYRRLAPLRPLLPAVAHMTTQIQLGFYAGVYLWIFVLLSMDRRDQIGHTVFAQVALVLVVFWPLFRWRRVAQKSDGDRGCLVSYVLVAAAVAVLQIFVVVRSLS